MNQENQDVLRTLRFMLQKDALGQDVYLIGPPGPLRRRIAMKYAELTKRTVEYSALSQDTTESDLKQRREISHGTARYVDCPATRAAINGSLLILDGVEKAERNVLVVLNNLLENREMALEDGRFLVAPKRYDNLLKDHSKEELDTWKLVRTSDRFRVVALGLPVPRYIGSALDPPFRSRFQARDVQGSRVSDQLAELIALSNTAVPDISLKCIVQAAAVIREMRESDGTSVSPLSALPEFPQGFETFIADLFSIIPELPGSFVCSFVFPQTQLLKGVTDDRLHVVSKIFRRFGLEEPHEEKGYNDGLGEPEDSVKEQQGRLKRCTKVRIKDIQLNESRTQATVSFHATIESPVSSGIADVVDKIIIVKDVYAGGSYSRDPGVDDIFVSTSSTDEALTRMTLAHCCNADFCLIGEKGGGKSRLTNFFARLFGYNVEHIPLYKDVSARQLLQRRSTLSNGDTIWEDSALVRAALLGRLAVLDGIEQMVPGTLATLQELVCDRECRLPDGRRLIGEDRIRFICNRDRISRDDLLARGVDIIHPNFRIVALARPSNLSGTSAQQARAAWLLPEIQTMFRFIYLQPMPPSEQATLLKSLAPNVTPTDLNRLNKFALMLREAIRKDDSLATLESTVSLRQTARVCRRLSSEEEGESGEASDEKKSEMSNILRKALLSAALDRFLPPLTRETFHSILDSCDIKEDLERTSFSKKSTEYLEPGEESWRIKMLPPETPGAIGLLKVGTHTEVDIFPPKDPLLVPSIVFYDNPRQTLIMSEMLRDWKSGQHLLLIGNQGVGKNKLADRMLQLLQLPREYIQLHRDTTVQNLTSNPTIINGRLMYEDSPLVRAAREGRILVVDEADKAPTYVTAVLKALVEDRSMLLSDGRRIVDSSHVCDTQEEEGSIIRLHKDFRVIALANRPGFPFHGNDFFREVGDVFACHAIDNPDSDSELHLMREYGPNVPLDAMKKLISAFDELRTLSDEGKLSYPYSTRELAAVIKHMERFPTDGVDRILRNVFDFDNYSQDERETLIQVFNKHGIPFSMGNDTFLVKTGINRKFRNPRFIEAWEYDHMNRRVIPLSKVSSLDSLARYNHGTGNTFWKLRQPNEIGNLQIQERTGQIFSEERYSFQLPRCSVLGCTLLSDGKLVICGRSATFSLYIVDEKHTKFESYDIFAALPSDGTYRSSPKLASIQSLPSRDLLLIGHQENGYFLILDVFHKQLKFLDQLPGIVKGGGRTLTCEINNNGIVAYYQKGEDHLSFFDFNQDKHGYLKCDIIIEQVFNVQQAKINQWLVIEKGTFHSYIVTLNIDENFCQFDKVQKREGSHLKKIYHGNVKMDYLSSSYLEVPIGGLTKENRAVVYSDGTVGFSSHIPMPNHELRGNFYSVTREEDEIGPLRQTNNLFLYQSQLLAVARERVDVYQVDLDIYDFSSFKYRTLQVNLEQDKLSQPPSVLKNLGSRPLTSLSPSDLGVFSLVRQAIADVSQRLFLLEHPDGHSLITIDCLGRVRVWYVTEQSIRKSFADWRNVVGSVDETENQLSVVYAHSLHHT